MQHYYEYKVSIYKQELVALIKSGVEPAESPKTTDAHLAAVNYDKIKQQVAQERKDEKKLQAYYFI